MTLARPWTQERTKDVVAVMWDYSDDRWGTMHDQDGSGWVMVILMLIVTIAVIVALVAVLRGVIPATGGRSVAGGGHAQDARRILQERFARGDLDEDEFRARMRALDDTSA